jgi:hypothetical protein
LYELWMFGGTLFFVGLAAFFFFVYGRRKAIQPSRVGAAAAPALSEAEGVVPASEARR